MGYEELNSHYESLNSDKIKKYNKSYEKYLDEHKRYIGNKFPPMPEYMFENRAYLEGIQDYNSYKE